MIRVEEIKYRFASARTNEKDIKDHKGRKIPKDFVNIASFFVANTVCLCKEDAQRDKQDQLMADRSRIENKNKKILIAHIGENILAVAAFEEQQNNLELEEVCWRNDNMNQEQVFEAALAWRLKRYAYDSRKTICGENVTDGALDFNRLLLKSHEQRGLRQ